MNEIETKTLRVIREAVLAGEATPSIRELASVLGYSSPRSAMLVVNRLIETGWLRRRADNSLQLLKDLEEDRGHSHTVSVPLVGNVACGSPILAEENIEAHIPVSESLARPGGKYFLLRATGDSMNAVGIDDGDILLVRQQSSAENGQKVVALIDDSATVKEFHREKDVVLLKPRSRNGAHKAIVLPEDFLVQGVIIATLPKLD